jgi:hypothetical protein
MSPGRDNPHSQAALRAGLPIGLGLAAAAVLVATSPLPAVVHAPAPFAAASPVHDLAAPPWWTSAENPAVIAAAGWPWDALALLAPIGERGVRGELLALALVLALAAAAGLLAFRLYRGTGRLAATVVAVPLTAALLLAWLHGRGAALASASPALGFGALAVLSLAAAIGARVHGRRLGLATGLRAGIVTAAAALVWPSAGLGLAALLLACGVWQARPGPISRALAVLCAGPAVLAAWFFGHDVSAMSCATCMSGQDFSATFAQISRLAGPALLHPALALLVLLVLPLRWRGGALLLVAAAAAIAGGILPVALALLAVAACGWIWLAGGVRGAGEARPVRAWLARLAVAAASFAVLALAAGAAGPRVDAPIAARRPERSLLAVVQRGLVAPGDVLLAHDPWLVQALAAARRDEGVRPDIVVLAAGDLDPARRGELMTSWQREGRRVLSDSFSDAGRWQAAWLLDSGPLFWLVGLADLGEREFTDLDAYTPDLADPQLAPAERARWERLHLERVRHRRALGRHDAAALALPVDEDTRAEVAQRIHLAELSRLPAIEGSELGPAPWSAAPPPASSLAEAGDLLCALGDGEAGAGFLERAAARGVPEAFAALARWYLRAGEEAAARETLAVMADPSLRPQLLAVCRWLLARAHADRSAELLRDLAHAPGHAPEELATRLAVLRGLAAPPTRE